MEAIFVVELLTSRGTYEAPFNTKTGFVYTYNSMNAALASVRRYYPWDYCARAFRIVSE